MLRLIIWYLILFAERITNSCTAVGPVPVRWVGVVFQKRTKVMRLPLTMRHLRKLDLIAERMPLIESVFGGFEVI